MALPTLAGSVLSGAAHLRRVVEGCDEHANFLALFDCATGKSRRSAQSACPIPVKVGRAELIKFVSIYQGSRLVC